MQVHDKFMHKLIGACGNSNSKVASSSPPSVSAGAGCGLTSGAEKEILPVKEQVEVLIEEATTPDNLAQMYEGWSAWI